LNDHFLLEADDGGMYGFDSPQLVGKQQLENGWDSLNGDIRDTEFFRVAFDSINGLVFGGAQDNGTSIQSGIGSTQWQPLPGGGGDGGVVAAGNDGTNEVNYYFSDSDPLRNGLEMQLADGPGGERFSGL